MARHCSASQRSVGIQEPVLGKLASPTHALTIWTHRSSNGVVIPQYFSTNRLPTRTDHTIERHQDFCINRVVVQPSAIFSGTHNRHRQQSSQNCRKRCFERYANTAVNDSSPKFTSEGPVAGQT